MWCRWATSNDPRPSPSRPFRRSETASSVDRTWVGAGTRIGANRSAKARWRRFPIGSTTSSGRDPRRDPYRDNVIHYNWHWFWRWGTGEICNNGTHEIDICRWALGVDHPVRVTSAGGRYHFDDDWDAYDTQIASFDFEGGKTITWEGRSCNGRPVEGRGRGAAIHAEKGTVIIDRSGYVVYDHDNNEIHRRMREKSDSALDVRGGGGLTDLHIVNFLETIRGNEKAHAPIDEGAKSTLLCHLGNIAQRTDRSLTCDPQTGRVLDNEEALGLWGREYEEGWEPSV